MAKKQVSDELQERASCMMNAGYLRGFARSGRVPTDEDIKVIVKASEQLNRLAKLLGTVSP